MDVLNEDCALPHTMQTATSIFTAGIACNALIVAEKVGIIQILRDKYLFNEQELSNNEQYKNPTASLAALRALCYAGILKNISGTYFLTDVGRDVVKNIGVFVLCYDGYANLFAKQATIAEGDDYFIFTDTKGNVVARASAMITSDTVDPIVVNIITKLQPKGAICDLGCGSAERLLKVCKATSVPGIGFDINQTVVNESQNNLARMNNSEIDIKVLQADATNLDGYWPEVDIVMQAFMTHHITPDSYCLKILNSYTHYFPNLRYFILMDTVTDDSKIYPNLFSPGFDYFHRLQGLVPRTRESISKIIAESNYLLEEEIEFVIPNTYLWLLKRT